MPLENPPIEERCGLETTDTIAKGFLVRAPIEQVAEVLAQSGVRWERDIYGQTIRGRGLLAFQFRGHAWTEILDGYNMTSEFRDVLDGYVSDDWNWELQAQSLSQKLHTRTIHYWVDDVGCTIGYAYWENGTLMERLEFDEDTRFESQLRQLTAAEIENAQDFVWDFLCEQKAYAATSFYAFNFQRDDFVRVDYIAFRTLDSINTSIQHQERQDRVLDYLKQFGRNNPPD